jgi:hypothetical protein
MRGKPLLPGERQLSSEFLVDSMILMHYDNGYDECISWWEEVVSNGCKVCVSIISLMERYKGVAGLPGPRDDTLRQFEYRIAQMRKNRKIHHVFSINKRISAKAGELSVMKRRFSPRSERVRRSSPKPLTGSGQTA